MTRYRPVFILSFILISSSGAVFSYLFHLKNKKTKKQKNISRDIRRWTTRYRSKTIVIKLLKCNESTGTYIIKRSTRWLFFYFLNIFFKLCAQCIIKYVVIKSGQSVVSRVGYIFNTSLYFSLFLPYTLLLGTLYLCLFKKKWNNKTKIKSPRQSNQLKGNFLFLS